MIKYLMFVILLSGCTTVNKRVMVFAELSCPEGVAEIIESIDEPTIKMEN